MDKRDLYIKAKLQEDKKISDQANEVFEKIKGEINLEENNKKPERKVIKLKLNQAIFAFTSLIIVFILGGNIYAHLTGKPNIYSAIKSLFVKEAKYTESEILVDQTVESNGIKLTLKTVAMDENALITKYVAEGEKLANEFYTYTEFEEDLVHYAKLVYAAKGFDIGEDGYKNISVNDANAKLQEITQKLTKIDITEEETAELLKTAKEGYCEFIGNELGDETCSEEDAKELITETIASFESKVSNKYQIIQSNNTLQNFTIYASTQKIEKSGNQYIIYNVYNVDTISDLASKFNLSINITQIGSIKGTWNYKTELEKARLDTRVETIEFYEDNSTNSVAPVMTSDHVWHSATVEAKKLIISDFSTVLMIQTSVKEDDYEYFLGGYAKHGLPCVFVVTDEEGNVLGTGSASEHTFEASLNNGSIKYTDRIILENVDKDTKKLYVNIYEQWDLSEIDEGIVKANSGKSLVLDIEKARNSSKPVELTQSYTSKDAQIAFKYPGEWKVEAEDYPNGTTEPTLVGPEDVDGKSPKIIFTKLSDKEEYEEYKNVQPDYGHGEILSTGEITVAGVKGYYKVVTFMDEYSYGKSKYVFVENDNQYYKFGFLCESETQYARYEETFNKILETIEFIEAEKSYTAYYSKNSSDSFETVKVYEDGTITVQISKSAKENFKSTNIEENKEYEIKNLPSVCDVEFFDEPFVDDLNSVYWGSCIIFYQEGSGNVKYLLDMNNALKTGNFVAVKIQNSENSGKVYVEDLAFEDRMVWCLVMDNDVIGGTQIISRDGTVEKYVAPEEPEQPEEPDTSSKYENMSYESFEINNGIIKQYEDSTVTVEWNDEINNYEKKLWEVKPNVEYVITGLDGKVKSVHNVIKDRQEKNMASIKIITDKGTLYGRFDLKTNYELQATMVGRIDNVETVVLQQSADKLVVITENDKAFIVNYDMYTIGIAPSKQTIYNCIKDYCESSEKLYLNESIENAFDNIAYLDNGDGNYKAEVRIKIFDSSNQKTKSMRAVIVFDTQSNNFKIETFDENPKGGGGY